VLADDVIISENQYTTINLADNPDVPNGTATINAEITVNDEFGAEAVIVNDGIDHDLWIIENYGNLISTDFDSVLINTNCTVNNSGTILSELEYGVNVEADSLTVINLNNNAGGLIQGSSSGVLLNFNLDNSCTGFIVNNGTITVSYTHLRAHET